MFFLLLFVQSFSTITSDTSPHQTSALALPSQKLTDDGPDTGNYCVRTLTANFNHNLPREPGSKSNLQPEPWAARWGQAPGGCSLLSPLRLLGGLVHAVRQAGVAPPALPSSHPLVPLTLFHLLFTVACGLSPTCAPRHGSGCGGCVAEHQGHQLGPAVPSHCVFHAADQDEPPQPWGGQSWAGGCCACQHRVLPVL